MRLLDPAILFAGSSTCQLLTFDERTGHATPSATLHTPAGAMVNTIVEADERHVVSGDAHGFIRVWDRRVTPASSDAARVLPKHALPPGCVDQIRCGTGMSFFSYLKKEKIQKFEKTQKFKIYLYFRIAISTHEHDIRSVHRRIGGHNVLRQRTSHTSTFVAQTQERRWRRRVEEHTHRPHHCIGSRHSQLACALCLVCRRELYVEITVHNYFMFYCRIFSHRFRFNNRQQHHVK